MARRELTEHTVKPLLINLTRKQIVRLYKEKAVRVRRKGSHFVIQHKVDKRIPRLEAKIAHYEAKLAEITK